MLRRTDGYTSERANERVFGCVNKLRVASDGVCVRMQIRACVVAPSYPAASVGNVAVARACPPKLFVAAAI